MAFSKRRLNLLVRVIALIATSMLLTFMVFWQNLVVTSILTGIVLFLQIYWLIQYLDRTNRVLIRFIESIKSKDASATFSQNSDDPYINELNKGFNDILESFKNVRIEKESQHQYLNTVVEHVKVGIISFSEDGKVELFNEAAKNMLKTPFLSNIKGLNRLHDDFETILKEIESKGQKLLKLSIGGNLLQLSLRTASVKLYDKNIKIVTLQNIKAELDAKELEAWQKLIRVLTHEIMNSVSPITSLSATIAGLIKSEFKENSLTEIDQSVMEDTVMGLETIQKRGQGLLKFVESYRSLTKLPKPIFERVLIKDLLNNIRLLMEESLKSVDISCEHKVDPQDLSVLIDEKLLVQVLINLIKNSKEALSEIQNAKILIHAFEQQGKCYIHVEDNGNGIPDVVMENIFTPFFTTKEKGSGIGLSLSKQIIQLHGGSITVQSKVGEGCKVILEL